MTFAGLGDGGDSFLLAHRVTFEGESVAVMDQPIE
jgi:hypothetical protein